MIQTAVQRDTNIFLYESKSHFPVAGLFSKRQSNELKQYVHPMSLSIVGIIYKIVNKYLYNFRSWNQTAQVHRSFIGRGNSYLILLKNWRILGLNYWWIFSTYNTQI